MTNTSDSTWTSLEPPLSSRVSQEAFVDYARKLAKACRSERADETVERVRRSFVARVSVRRCDDRQVLLTAGLVITDLATQGWTVRMHRKRIDVRPPESVTDPLAEKQRIRRQELVKRNVQLRQPAVQRFLKSMERLRLHGEKHVTIYSLMRDGRELGGRLREARAHLNDGWSEVLSKIIDPYLQFVTTENDSCEFTGLRLMDVWRYFRHTWANQYTSVPGRTMAFLVRDRAAENHPVIGIGALSSPIMQIRERDMWIGWHPETFLDRVRTAPTVALAKWLVKTLDDAMEETYVADLIEDKIITTRELKRPTLAVIGRLLKESANSRKKHHRFFRSRDFKKTRSAPGDDHWIFRAKTPLFRSKRALALSTYLSARLILDEAFEGNPTAAKLAVLAKSERGSDAIRSVLKKAKADRIGIAVADISVCGAVQPYNAILGGKLTAMMATSPEIVNQYRRRYARAESEIASSMAGRSIVRASKLVLLGTTSLYGVGSSQYNRIKIPTERLGGEVGGFIRFEELGRSEAFGTSQYSEETVEALVDLVQQSKSQRVNSIFGEGVSPKMRKVRQALDLLNLPSGALLRHHRPRVVYAVSLIKNLGEYLIGIDKLPKYVVPANEGVEVTTAAIGAWWRERWLRNRIISDEVLEEVGRHTRVHPITHGGRVLLQRTAFSDQS